MAKGFHTKPHFIYLLANREVVSMQILQTSGLIKAGEVPVLLSESKYVTANPYHQAY